MSHKSPKGTAVDRRGCLVRPASLSSEPKVMERTSASPVVWVVAGGAGVETPAYNSYAPSGGFSIGRQRPFQSRTINPVEHMLRRPDWCYKECPPSMIMLQIEQSITFSHGIYGAKLKTIFPYKITTIKTIIIRRISRIPPFKCRSPSFYPL